MHKEVQTLIILTPGFPESEADINCLPMQQGFVLNLKKINPTLNIIVLSFQYPYNNNVYKWFGITVMSFNGQNKGGLQRLLLRRKLNDVLKKIQNENNIIGLLSFWYGECAWVGNRFAGKHQLKHLCWILGQDAKKENKYPKRVNADPGELIALSDFLQDEFETNHSIKPRHVVPPGIDITSFSTAVNPRNIDIIGVGSLIPLKQFDIFIRVVATLVKKFPSLKAVICGDGPEKNKLAELIDKAGIQNNITLMGELAHPEILSLMQRSKILLHTSSYEGFANVYSEALYAGAHVVGFCKPMLKIFDHQHVVTDETEMINEAVKILSGSKTDHTPVLTYPIEDTCRQLLGLFNKQ